MIQKVTKILCDNCRCGIYDWPENLSCKEVANICKEKDIAVVRYVVGKRTPLTFCDEKCLEEWAKKHGYTL